MMTTKEAIRLLLMELGEEGAMSDDEFREVLYHIHALDGAAHAAARYVKALHQVDELERLRDLRIAVAVLER